MKVGIIDFESTGFANNTHDLKHPSQPEAVSFGLLICDEFAVQAQTYFLIQGEKESGVEAMEKHRITLDMRKEYGINKKVAGYIMWDMLRAVDILFGYKHTFDMKMMDIVLATTDIVKFDSTQIARKVDLCAEFTPICQLPFKGGRNGNKPPTLEEAYNFAFGSKGKPYKFHRAIDDCFATASLGSWLKTVHPDKFNIAVQNARA